MLHSQASYLALGFAIIVQLSACTGDSDALSAEVGASSISDQHCEAYRFEGIKKSDDPIRETLGEITFNRRIVVQGTLYRSTRFVAALESLALAQRNITFKSGPSFTNVHTELDLSETAPKACIEGKGSNFSNAAIARQNRTTQGGITSVKASQEVHVCLEQKHHRNSVSDQSVYGAHELILSASDTRHPERFISFFHASEVRGPSTSVFGPEQSQLFRSKTSVRGSDSNRLYIRPDFSAGFVLEYSGDYSSQNNRSGDLDADAKAITPRYGTSTVKIYIDPEDGIRWRAMMCGELSKVPYALSVLLRDLTARIADIAAQ